MSTDRKGQVVKGSRRSPTRQDGSVRVWGSIGITVAVSENPPQFIKLESGHERVAPDDSEETLDRYQRLIDDRNEKWIERQLHVAERLMRKGTDTVAEKPEPGPRERARKRAKKR